MSFDPLHYVGWKDKVARAIFSGRSLP